MSRVPWQRSRIAGSLLALAALVGVLPEVARAGVLTREALANAFPSPYLVKEKEKDVPVWPIFKQSGPPNFTTDLVGYVFESADLAPVPGFSGTPINLLVAMNTNGEFMDVAVLSHHEPVFVGGVGEEPLVRFLTQYKGLGLKQNITVGSGTARTVHIGGTNVYLDGISRATASLRIINQSVLASALKVARTKLGFSGGRDPDLIAHVRTDLFQPQTWSQLVDAGLVRHLSLSNRDVEQAFAGSEGAGLDPEALARPDAPFCDLYAAMVTVPMAGRNLLNDASWNLMNGRVQPGDHVLLVMAKGRCRFVSETFQRNTVPDRLTLNQSGLPVEMRDLDLEAPMRAIGQPDFDQVMAFRVIFQAGLDPGEPMRLSMRVPRSRGIVYPDRYHARLRPRAHGSTPVRDSRRRRSEDLGGCVEGAQGRDRGPPAVARGPDLGAGERIEPRLSCTATAVVPPGFSRIHADLHRVVCPRAAVDRERRGAHAGRDRLAELGVLPVRPDDRDPLGLRPRDARRLGTWHVLRVALPLRSAPGARGDRGEGSRESRDNA